MPLHDWTRVNSGLFHHFHQGWCVEISRVLNRGKLQTEFSALVEQKSGSKEADVLAIEEKYPYRGEPDTGGTAVLERPKTKLVHRSDRDYYAEKASRVAIHHRLGKVVAFIEIVSPGNKHDELSFERFVEKIVEAIRQRIHVMVIDLFPPTSRDPLGIHKAIWDHFEADEPFEDPNGQDRILASYEADGTNTAFIEPLGVGERLPEMPLFISPGAHVLVPLEETYANAWSDTPGAVQRLVEQ